LADYRLSGVWRLLHRCRVRLRCARVPLSSPDPD
jgi:transposase